MTGRSAVVFLLDDTYRTGSDTPLMLHRILGVPLLQWLAHALERSEVRRFFLVCAPSLLPAARACFPPDAELTAASDEGPADLLHVFLSTADDSERDVLVITGPVLYTPLAKRAGAAPANACMVDRLALMDALDETAPVGHFLRQTGEPVTGEDGFFSLSTPEELPGVSRLLTQDLLAGLTRSGVEIWDPNNTYVTPASRWASARCFCPVRFWRAAPRWATVVRSAPTPGSLIPSSGTAVWRSNPGSRARSWVASCKSAPLPTFAPAR